MQQRQHPRVQLAGLLLKGAGLLGMAIWSFSFARGALDAALGAATVPTTGGPTYVYIGLMSLVLVFIDERRVDVRRQP